MARETKKQLRKDLMRVVRAVVLQDKCITLLIDALPDSKGAVKARIEGMRSQGANLWMIPYDE